MLLLWLLSHWCWGCATMFLHFGAFFFQDFDNPKMGSHWYLRRQIHKNRPKSWGRCCAGISIKENVGFFLKLFCFLQNSMQLFYLFIFFSCKWINHIFGFDLRQFAGNTLRYFIWGVTFVCLVRVCCIFTQISSQIFVWFNYKQVFSYLWSFILMHFDEISRLHFSVSPACRFWSYDLWVAKMEITRLRVISKVMSSAMMQTKFCVFTNPTGLFSCKCPAMWTVFLRYAWRKEQVCLHLLVCVFCASALGALLKRPPFFIIQLIKPCFHLVQWVGLSRVGFAPLAPWGSAWHKRGTSFH